MRISLGLWAGLCLALALLTPTSLLHPAFAQQPASGPVPATLYSGLHWRMIGPFRGGRVNAVTGVPGQPNTFYFGSVGGGVWKSTNAGRTWQPIFDSQPVASIGAVAVAPSRPDTVYVGTGEADMRDSIGYGDGMYRSDDAGTTWRHIGLEATRQIGRVIVDARNPDVVFVAALGHAFGPNPERGVYRSRDGGRSWQKVLDKGDSVGAIDLAFEPGNSQVVYAALWATRRPPWYIYAPANGPGSGIAKSTDGGTTWRMLTAGLPTDAVGRIGIAVAPSSPRRVYAIVDAKPGGLYRSDDGGESWMRTSGDARIWGRGWYFGKVAVDPRNPDVVYVSNTSLYRSGDGGKSWTAIKGAPGGDDYHQLWIAPDDPARMILASDQGAIVTVDGATTWSSWYNQPTAQLYHVAADNRVPYWVTGAQQDSGPVGTPTRSLYAEISMRDWRPVCAGGESGYTAPDPLRREMLFGDIVTRCNVVDNVGVNVSPERGAAGGPFRHAWTQPLVFSSADPHALYFANQYLYKTVNGGTDWTRISNDLTREDPGVPPNLDAAAAADAPPGKRRGVIYTIAPSPLLASLIWIGTDDGLIQVTEDEKTWRDVTPKAITPWSRVMMLEASHADARTAYAAVERHQLDDYEPYIYRTRDGGATWQRITNGVPPGAYVQTIKEDPMRPGLLFAGTERSVFVSFDAGDDWQPLALNLPATSMRDLAIHGDDLIVATHGRGFWVLDCGLALLRQIDARSATAVRLFKPANVPRIPPGSEDGTPLPRDEPFAPNPPYGAYIDYYLPQTPASPLAIEVLDSAGRVVRRVTSDEVPAPPDPNTLNIPAFWVEVPQPLSVRPGMHRWVWDLRGARTQAAGTGGERQPPLAAVGSYTVRMTVDGRTFDQTLRITPDPRDF